MMTAFRIGEKEFNLSPGLLLPAAYCKLSTKEGIVDMPLLVPGYKDKIEFNTLPYGGFVRLETFTERPYWSRRGKTIVLLFVDSFQVEDGREWLEPEPGAGIAILINLDNNLEGLEWRIITCPSGDVGFNRMPYMI